MQINTDRWQIKGKNQHKVTQLATMNMNSLCLDLYWK